MKNLFKFLLAVVALAVVGCTTDTTEDLAPNIDKGNGLTTITLSLDGTRTHLGAKGEEGYPLYWSKGDKIAINGAVSAALGEEFDGQSAAIFAFEGELTTPYNIVYPAPAEGVTASAEGLFPVTFPASQNYTAGTFESGTAPMYGYAAAPAEGEEAAAIQLNHLAGVLRFAVKGSKTLTSMTVVAENGKIAGDFDVNCKNGALTAHEDASNTITVLFGEGLALKADEATPIYVAVPAGEHGIYTITLFTDEAENNAMVIRFNSDNHPVKAGVVKEFAEFEFVANATAEPVSGELVIENEVDLVRLAKMSEVGLLGSVTSVRVAATLDMSKVEGWHGIDRFPAITFDGGSDKGYEIKGLTAPLFNTINGGTIKNVKLNMDITVEEGAIFGALANVVRSTAEQVAVIDNCVTSGKLVVATTYKGTTTNDSEIAVSPMIGQAYGATITNCANNASIEIKAISAATTTQIKPCVGGVVAYLGAGEEGAAAPVLKNCVNNESAKITWNETEPNTKLNPYIAGVVGGYLTEGSAENLTNYADIEVLTDMYVPNIGGVCGYLHPSAATYCYNHGDITIDSATSYAYWGGVFGSVYNKTMTITSCENHGDVTFGENASCAARNYIGGVIGTSQSQGAVYSKLKNTGTIANYGKNEKTRFFMGGVIGYCWKVGLLDECVNGEQGTNKGAVIVTNELGLKETYYPAIGGVCGCFYPNAGEYSIKNSVNYAPVTVSTTVVNVMQQAIGGVVGWGKNAKLSGCDNYGAINCDGITNSAKLPLFIGGVCGLQNGSKGAIDGCDNSGAITLGEAADGVLQLGGVVGYGTHSVTNCSNSGKITIKGSPSIATTGVGKIQGDRTDRDYANRSNIGGVVGKIYSTTAGLATSYTSLENTGEIYMPQADSLKCIAIGGVLGEVTINTATMSDVKNSGAIKIENATNKGMYVAVGGILGRNFNDKFTSQKITISSWNNSGDISVSETSGIRHIRAGGLIGDLLSAGASKFETVISMTNSRNSGDISRVTKAKGSSQSFAGGLIGGIGASMTSANESHMGTDITISGCENSGNVQFDQYDGSNSLDNTAYCNASGGIVGMVYGGLTNTPARAYVPTIKGCTNKGTISAHAGAVGGIVGIIRDWCKVEGTESACNVNEGEVKLLGTVNGYAGGIVGHIYEADHANCDIAVVYSNNKGAVSGTQYVGGIVGASSSTIATAIANCVNVGKVSGAITSGTSDAKYAGYVGGIAGSVAANITSSNSHCDIEAPYYANVGGITGSPRAGAVVAQSCKLGGKIARTTTKEEDANGGDPILVPEYTEISDSNFYEYIYGAAVEEATAVADGCSFLSVKPTI
ncbi:MAG: hypothetical protein IKA26_01855 [Alistipes sp.]|nr:hypothetical protein [Alistipes sp.]